MKLRENETTDWWEEISKEEQASIEKGIQNANLGKLNSHSKARNLYEKWL